MTSENGTAAATAAPNILIVDDRPANLLSLEAVLDPIDVRLVRAQTAHAALQAVREQEFAVILLDVQMPEMDGYELARRIKSLEAPRLTPVIFMTALLEDRRQLHAGYESGAVDYLFKPLDPDILRAKVQAFVRMYVERNAAERSAQQRYADMAEQEAARASAKRAAAILESITDAFYALDDQFRFTYVNRKAEELWGRTRDELLGREYLAEFPEARASETFDMHRRAMAERRAMQYETISPILGRWISVSLYPESSGGLSCYFQDISQRKEAEDERERLLHSEREARTHAEQANVVKSQFLATMSHELRTPLNAQIGYAQLLEMGLAGSLTADQQRYVQRLTHSSGHLLSLINDILDFSKIEAGELSAQRDNAWTGPLVHDAINLIRPQAVARKVEIIDEQASDKGVSFVGDAQRVRQILVNLLSNAVKFTDSGGRVTVTCGTESAAPAIAQVHGDGPWAFLRVEDTGIGIAAEQLSHVFDPFHQVDSSHTRQQGGTGLGLAISRRLSRLMSGDLTAESTPNSGSTFTLWLPAIARTSPDEAQTQLKLETPAARAERADSTALGMDSPDLDQIGTLLRGMIDDILTAYADRLRLDPQIPQARWLRRPQLEDHQVTFLADLAQTLLIISEAGAEAADLLRDGSAIQRAVSQHHGIRRHAQGWTENAVRRDHQILREEIEHGLRAGLRSRALSSRGASVEEAVRLLLHLVDTGESISVQAWRHANEGTNGKS